jgi:hypothetical protein
MLMYAQHKLLSIQHGSGSRRQARAYESIREHTSAYFSIRQRGAATCAGSGVSIRQHTSAYVSIRQHTSAYVSIRQRPAPALASLAQHVALLKCRKHVLCEHTHTDALSIRIRKHSIRKHVLCEHKTFSNTHTHKSGTAQKKGGEMTGEGVLRSTKRRPSTVCFSARRRSPPRHLLL